MKLKDIISIIVIILPGLYLGYLGLPTEMGLAIVAGAIAAAFINLDRIERFKGAGFEAEMRKVVEEAYATMENLKELGKPLIISIIANLTYIGRFGGMNNHQKHNFRDELVKLSELLSIKDHELIDALNLFHRYHTWDHLSRITSEANKTDELLEARQKLNELKSYKSDVFPTKNQIIEIFSTFQISNELSELIEDYDYYLKHKKLRRSETLGMD